MKLLGNTRKLEIITENCHEAEEKYLEISGIKYPLYEANYISGIRTIFQQAIGLTEWNENNEGRYILGEKRNVLSFVGGRGTGKTTAMDEFCRILSSMKETATKTWWLTHTLSNDEQKILQNENFYFHILKPIDASLLADKEDLFELILSNLYHEFESKMKNKIKYGFKDDPIIKEIMKDFSEISRLYHNMATREREGMGDAFLAQLQLMEGSQEIQKRVTNLVKNLMELDKTNCKYEYIVIAIDDLDLNINHGYEMLEQLQKYFSDYRIIVLVAIDYEQMQRVCEEHFLNEMPKTSQKNENEEHTRKLAYDYMIKMFHLSQRMYMPDMHRIAKKSQIELPKEVFKTECSEYMVPVKEFVLSKIAETMGIFYDACGLKEHFSEPDTIRNLVSYNEFLESLDEVELEKLVYYPKLKEDSQRNNNIELIRKYDQIHEHFNEDINVRMVNALLNYEQKAAFKKLLQQDLQRRAKHFVYAERIPEKGICFKNITGKEYSYGHLLEKIYDWGRENEDYFEDKPFIRCVLASFTSEMVCEYIKYRYNPDEKRREKYKTRLVGFMGDSFGSEWVGKMFPEIIAFSWNDLLLPNTNLSSIYGYAKKLAQRMLSVDINIDCFKDINIDSIRSLKKIISEWMDREQIVETIECIDMFFIRKEGDSYKGIDFEFLYREKEDDSFQTLVEDDNQERISEKQFQMRITGMGPSVTLDIMAFVTKSLDYQNEQERLHEMMVEGLKRFIGGYLQIWLDAEKMMAVESTIRAKIKKKSLFEKYINDSFEYEVAFPFYNLDISYNIMKRVREHYKGKVIEQNDLLEELIKFYDYIGVMLEDEETVYEKLVDFKYARIFRNSPYVKILTDWNKRSSKVPDRLQQVFFDMGAVITQKITD